MTCTCPKLNLLELQWIAVIGQISFLNDPNSEKLPHFYRANERSHPPPDLKPRPPPISLKTNDTPLLPILKVVPCEKDLLPPQCQRNFVKIMKLTIAIGELTMKNIIELREMAESDVHFQNVSVKDLSNWIFENPEIVEHSEIRYEYNSFLERFTIKCMPTATHASLHSFFIQTVLGSFVEKGGLLKAFGLTVGSGTCFAGFQGDRSGWSEKRPDGFVISSEARFPTVVCEAGWEETLEELMEDARLWLLNTGGQTKVVIVLCFTETHIKSGTDLGSEMSGEEMGTEKSQTEERILIESINESTKFLDLARRLHDLNKEDKLQTPLIGELQASLHVYRASEDSKDLTESFRTTILPLPLVDFEGPREFQITMQDILGEDVPTDLDPTDPITFSLPVLEALIAQSLPRTAWSRANKRAEKLMKEAGVWEERETFAQYKRRRAGGA